MSIKEIHLKLPFVDDFYINQFVDIAKHCQQLETVHFHSCSIQKEMLSRLMTMLPIKQLIFTSCPITKGDAQFVVDFLKKGDHHFCEIKLFETKRTDDE